MASSVRERGPSGPPLCFPDTRQPPASAPRGWHSRGYLPHFDSEEIVQAITFRLADSLPAASVPGLQERAALQGPEMRRRIAELLDAGHGSCALRDPNVARLVEAALMHFDRAWYRLLAWVVMPNHVHVLIRVDAGHALSKIVRIWKSYTAAEANKLLRRSGRFWQPDYFDRFIRNERHFQAAVGYIEMNPVRAGLVACPRDWPFGSARHGRGRA